MEPIISSAIQQQQADIAMRVQMSVLKKNMDVQRDVGEMLVSLIETAAPPSLKAPVKTPGLGENIDLYA